MLIIHIVRSGSQYSVGKFHFKDIVALVVHLNLRDVTQKNRHCSKATGFTQPVHDEVR